MCVVNGLENVVRCPACGTRFAVEDLHRPFRCPRCSALLSYCAPLWRVEVLYTAKEMVSGERE